MALIRISKFGILKYYSYLLNYDYTADYPVIHNINRFI